MNGPVINWFPIGVRGHVSQSPPAAAAATTANGLQFNIRAVVCVCIVRATRIINVHKTRQQSGFFFCCRIIDNIFPKTIQFISVAHFLEKFHLK